MINIAIIDDQKEYLELIVDRIQHICKDRDDVVLFPHTSANRLLEEVEEGVRYDAVICDIEMDEMDGMELGKILKDKWPTLYLIFLTSFSQYALDGFRVSAYQYILKEEVSERLAPILLELFDKIVERHETYQIIGPTENRKKIMCADMIAITKDTNSKYINITTIDGVVRERSSLEQFLKGIDSDKFVVVNRGEAINLRHVIEIRQDVIYLSNKTYVRVSRSRLNEVKMRLMDNWEKL